MARKFTAVALSLGCIHASSVFALGLGDLQMESFLNEPLQAQVDLLNTSGLHADEIHIRLATREDFERMGVDRAYFLTSIKFTVSVDASGRGTITLTSEEPVLEPYLDFIVEARWPSGRLLREYTVLVDPPLFDASAPVISASERVEEVEGIPAPESEAKKTEGAAATSGTRVDVRQSSLSPGEMPQRDFNAAAGEMPAAGGRYMIHRDDTLWEIASRAKPAGASVHQTMLDIQRLNPDAFINGNINQIKAGYIIYLPKEGDISSQDLPAALAEVKQQNEDWRAGRASTPSSGPSLRISAEPDEDTGDEGGDTAGRTVGAAVRDEDAEAALADADRRVGDLEAQVDSLERMVSLKDRQIAELQAALAAAQGEAAAASDMGEAETGVDEYGGPESMAAAEGVEPEPVAEKPAAPVEQPAKTEAAKPKQLPPAKAPPPSSGGWMSYLLYGAGALILAVLAVVFVRKRRGDEVEAMPTRTAADPFAGKKLKPRPAVEPPAAEAGTVEEEDDLVTLEESPGKMDFSTPAAAAAGTAAAAAAGGSARAEAEEYATDGESGDAMAEADIYIAYGRYPQARELLRTALAGDPDNSGYRLKLLEAELHLGNRPAAREQLYEIEGRGDAAAAARARELLGETDSFAEPPAGLAEEVDANLESEFAGLEIEGGEDEGVEDDLDLSGDFLDSPLGDEDEEDLVIAAEANGMSTKLDLARAYLDMGDEDGARQILEEVIAEGSDDVRSEAESLLARID